MLDVAVFCCLVALFSLCSRCVLFAPSVWFSLVVLFVNGYVCFLPSIYLVVVLFPSLLCFFSVGAAILFAIAVIVRLAVLAGRVVFFVLCRFLVKGKICI